MALIFDLDGTLIDSAIVVGDILNGMRAERNLPPLEADFYRHWSSRGGQELVGRALAIEPASAAPQVEEFRRRYRERPTPPDSLYPGALDMLARLRAWDVRLAICSNKPEHLCRKVLAETGLGAHFEAITGGDTTPFGKPHRAPLDHAMAAIGANPSATLMIGDSTVDQKTAAATGIPFVLFAGGYDDGVDRSQTAAIITTLPDLLGIVALRPLDQAELAR